MTVNGRSIRATQVDTNVDVLVGFRRDLDDLAGGLGRLPSAAALLAAHTADPNPHPLYATDADLTAHTAAADPHPVYTTDAEASYLAALGLAITFGTWTAYTPATSNVSGSNPVNGWYVRAGMTCWYQITMTNGNTASSANPIQFYLPPGVTGARLTPADAMKGAAKVSAIAGNNSALTVTVWADAAGTNFTNGQGLGTIRLIGMVESTT